MSKRLTTLLMLAGLMSSPVYGAVVTLSLQQMVVTEYGTTDTTNRNGMANAELAALSGVSPASGLSTTNPYGVEFVSGSVSVPKIIHMTSGQSGSNHFYMGSVSAAIGSLAAAYGNRVDVGYVAKTGGLLTIRLADVAINGVFTNDGTNGQGYGFSARGLYYGADRIKGTADDVSYNTLTTPASALNPVDEIYGYTSMPIGGGFTSSNSGAQLQTDLDAEKASYSPFLPLSMATPTFQVFMPNHTTTLTQETSGIVTIANVPEPGVLGLVGLTAGFSLSRRRTRR